MYTIIKLLKSLNSTQATYQLSLALVFGMFSGFLPFLSLVNVVIILIVFSLNIPLGVYAVFTLLFTILGSILDSTFAVIGYDILTNSSLSNFWTNLYNFNPALWFNFNHTITLGSLIVSLILSLPLYFISKPLFNKYRLAFSVLSQKIKIFKWFTPEIDTTKKVRLFRLWGAGLFIGVLSSLAIFFILLFDPILKYGFEYSLSKATNATVKIENLVSNIKDTNIKFKNISMSKDGKKNSVDNIFIDLDTEHLLNKKLDIKLIDIQNIILSQATKIENNNDDSSSNTTSKSTSASKNDSGDKFKVDLPNIDELLEKENLKSVKEAKAIKARFNKINKKWKEISTKNKSEILKNIKYYKDEYNKDKAILSADAKKIKTLPDADYKHLTSKYSLDQDGALNIVSTYISEDISKYTKMGLKYYNMIKPYLNSDEEKDEEIRRLEGTWIKFKETTPYPSFVLQKLTANIVSEQFDKSNINLSYNGDTNFLMQIENFKSKKLDKLTKYMPKDTPINLDISTNIKQSEKFENAKFSIKSNLDKELKNAFKKEAKKKMQKFKKELKSKLQDKIKDQIGGVDNNSFNKYKDTFKNAGKDKAKDLLKNKLKSFF